MKRAAVSFLILILALLVAPLSAQEETETPTAQPLPEATIAFVISEPSDPSSSISIVPVVIPDNENISGFSKTEIILIGALLVLVVSVGLILRQNSQLAKAAADAMPEWGWSIIQNITDDLSDRLEAIVTSTPNTIDDDLFRRLEDEKDKFFASIRSEVQEQIAQAVNESARAVSEQGSTPKP